MAKTMLTNVPVISRIIRVVSHLNKYWIIPIVQVSKIIQAPLRYIKYLRSWSAYQRLPGADRLHFGDSYPQLFDATESTSLDSHYFYQAIWATEGIAMNQSKSHVDIGSLTSFVGMLTVHTPVIFVDIRPIKTQLSRLTCLSGSILNLPFANDSLKSISCLHVAEHIGLGRYGDPLNPLGTQQACAEISRVLARTVIYTFLYLLVGRAYVSMRIAFIAQIKSWNTLKTCRSLSLPQWMIMATSFSMRM
jgi:hypothetical protein